MSRSAEDLVDALTRDVESAREFALAGSCLVGMEHGFAEFLSCSVEALERLVGDSEASDNLADIGLCAHVPSLT